MFNKIVSITLLLTIFGACSSPSTKVAGIHLLEDESDNFMFLGDTERLRGRLKDSEQYYARAAGAYLLKLANDKFILAASKAAMTALLDHDSKKSKQWLEKAEQVSTVWQLDSVDLKIATASYLFYTNKTENGLNLLRQLLKSDNILLEKKIYIKFLIADKENTLPEKELESDFQGLVSKLEDTNLENPEILIYGGLVLAEKFLFFNDLSKGKFYLDLCARHLKKFEAIASVKKLLDLKEKWFLKSGKVEELESLQKLQVDYSEQLKKI